MKLPWPFSQSAFRKIGKRVVDKIDTYRTATPVQHHLQDEIVGLQKEIEHLRGLLQADDRLRAQISERQVQRDMRAWRLLERIEALRQALADIVTGNAMPPNVPVPDGILHAANEALKADDIERQRDK